MYEAGRLRRASHSVEHFERREMHTKRLAGKLKESDDFEDIEI
jgi:hypothetical protein